MDPITKPWLCALALLASSSVIAAPTLKLGNIFIPAGDIGNVPLELVNNGQVVSLQITVQANHPAVAEVLPAVLANNVTSDHEIASRVEPNKQSKTVFFTRSGAVIATDVSLSSQVLRFPVRIAATASNGTQIPITITAQLLLNGQAGTISATQVTNATITVGDGSLPDPIFKNGFEGTAR